jgi:hypothetical protein
MTDNVLSVLTKEKKTRLIRCVICLTWRLNIPEVLVIEIRGDIGAYCRLTR